jgi:hypothetical protein
MALAVTLADLRSQVRTQTDTENDTHVTDAEIDGWINKGIRVFTGQLQRTDPDMYIVSVAVTTVAGTREYDFTDAGAFNPVVNDFRAIRGMDYADGGQVYTLRSFPWLERNKRGPLVAGVRDLPRYRVARNGTNGATARLTFDIDPSSRGYTMHYLPTPTVLTNDTDELDGVMGWDDYVVAYAGYRVHMKANEVEEAQGCQIEMARVEQDIKTMGADRHTDGFERIARTRRRRRGLHREYDEQY